MSKIESLISKIWWSMPEIFDQNHDWIGALISNKTFVYLLFRVIYRVTLAFVERRWSIEHVNAKHSPKMSRKQMFILKIVMSVEKW